MPQVQKISEVEVKALFFLLIFHIKDWKTSVTSNKCIIYYIIKGEIAPELNKASYTYSNLQVHTHTQNNYLLMYYLLMQNTVIS